MPERYLYDQWHALRPRDQVTMFVARTEGVATSALWVTRHEGVMTCRLVGWDASLPGHPNANEVLHWYAMLHGRDRGDHTFDFGGIDRDLGEALARGEAPDLDRYASTARFKLAFGGRAMLLPPTRFRVTVPLIGRVSEPLVHRALASERVDSLARRLRGGAA
jgi:hypothetical protein